MPITVTVPSTTPITPCEWMEVFGEAWNADPGSYLPLGPVYLSDGGELGLEVDGPWASELIISKVRLTFTGASSITLQVYDSNFDADIFESYTSGQEVDVNITPTVPLGGLFLEASPVDTINLSSIEFCVTPPDPVDPSTLECTDYTDDIYWDSSASIGNFYDVPSTMWLSIEDEGDEVLTLIPPGISPWTTGWNEGYQPAYARIFFTGPSTVDVVMLQKGESEGPGGVSEIALVSEEGYSSGDVLTLANAWYEEPGYRLSRLSIGNTSSTTTIIVSSIVFCYGPLVTQEWEDPDEARSNSTRFPPLGVPTTIKVLPGSYGAAQFYPFYPSDGSIYDEAYPITVTSVEAENFTVTGLSMPSFIYGASFQKSTTNGSLSGICYCSYYSFHSPLTVVVENEEVGSEGDEFDITLGVLADSTSTSTALASPDITLNEANQTWDYRDEIYIPICLSIKSGRHGCVQYLGDGDALGGYNITVESFDHSVDFSVGVYSLTNIYSAGEESVNGVAQVYVDYPSGTYGFKVLIYVDQLQNIPKFNIRWPQPF